MPNFDLWHRRIIKRMLRTIRGPNEFELQRIAQRAFSEQNVVYRLLRVGHFRCSCGVGSYRRIEEQLQRERQGAALHLKREGTLPLSRE